MNFRPGYRRLLTVAKKAYHASKLCHVSQLGSWYSLLYVLHATSYVILIVMNRFEPGLVIVGTTLFLYHFILDHL